MTAHTAVMPEVTGYRVAAVLADVGQYVRKGQVLVKLDPALIEAQIAQAQANYDQTVALYRQQVLQSFQDVEDNLAALRIFEDESKAQKDAVADAVRSENLSIIRYKGGLATYLEVITTQSTALADERTLASLETERMSASVLLIKAIGGTWDTSQLPHN